MIMNARRALGLATLASAIVVGWGCKGTTESTSPTPATAEDACGDLFDALTAYTPCTGPVPLVSTGRKDRYVKICAMQLAAPGANALAAVGKCADAIRNAAPSCGSFDAACAPSPGTLATGAPCGSQLQCASGFCNVGQYQVGSATLVSLASASIGTCGVCAEKIPIGGACTPYPNPPCVDGAECDGAKCVAQVMGDVGTTCNAPGSPICKSGLTCAPIISTCQPPSDVGGPCGACKGQLACVNDVCVVGKKEGEACGPSANDCATPLVCDQMTSTCRALTISPSGAPCGTAYAFCETAYCTWNTSTMTGTCPALLAEGAACDPSGVSGSVCDVGATCGVPTFGNGFPDAGPGGPGGPVDGSAPPPIDAGGPTCVLFDPSSCH
jgi:hypothetical protein